ncbi:hypothetical protein EJ04DRAFT_564567 [Polyplosphaeria fusca]|uniref:Protein kinase domain-containing protein n=1 Tax=Polyplosphaeria fusca TaxID=682080 RepID=A0A9P4QZ57_9PLEO|nr:hypothetical protein EJ04DRAFT_564567 [Polyplosphaeria fusca]
MSDSLNSIESVKTIAANAEGDASLAGSPEFCRQTPVNAKGGTATVYQAWIPVGSQYRSHSYILGECAHSRRPACYQVAVKKYQEVWKDAYEREKLVLPMLGNTSDVPVFRYLGSFAQSSNRSTSYNILLEFAELDLDEFWADLSNVPPVQSDQIVQFWASLFHIAKAIEALHCMKANIRGQEKRFHGWHADIKPDNILLVGKDFKLADFDFTQVAENRQRGGQNEATRTHISGETNTCGAPEFLRAEKLQTNTHLAQAIDIWSFGCVLSMAATWMVLSFQGIRQYEASRIVASRKHWDNEAADRFHDGYDILPEVQQWHAYLMDHVRVSDSITCRVLQLVERGLLKGEAAHRLTAAQLCTELDQLLQQAEKDRTESSLDPEIKRVLSTV